ncbi:hypothetical protein [Pseudoleptotrichia goodfellowii]|uniref:Uncharacterized protein n=1 Tax=Pseudoleptotrichia goodfellowii TaxID=157692 RepID=A0A510JA33_9FUSO|nr:hypothetical protein [Pseudoleptotrichia goodfellowii]BBM36172.1 hypothetical protein JCM16774_1104 [Pseudoleptotrichia goodfellowii]
MKEQTKKKKVSNVFFIILLGIFGFICLIPILVLFFLLLGFLWVISPVLMILTIIFLLLKLITIKEDWF